VADIKDWKLKSNTGKVRDNEPRTRSATQALKKNESDQNYYIVSREIS